MKIVVALLFVVLATVSASYGSYYRRPCKKRCDSAVLYVCGNDGVNYINECALGNAICDDKTGKLAKRNNGLCEDVFGRLRGTIYDPVCGSDGKTYSSIIYMNAAACLTKRSIYVKKQGTCKCRGWCNRDVPKCDIGCPVVYDPVCGDDGQTYMNECVLEKQNCLLGGKALKKAYKGCCEVVYSRVVGIEPFSPVCANDGNTYSSKSFVDLARCQNPSLKIVKYRACH